MRSNIIAAVQQANTVFGGIDILINNASAISLTNIDKLKPSVST
jgi:NADP-dependent 3-hydroxy acid dehydrogenase YdfG